MKKRFILICILFLGFTLIACNKADVEEPVLLGDDMTQAEVSKLAHAKYFSEDNPVITIKIKDLGEMKAELFPNIAPNTVKNFIAYIQAGKFTNSTFHRVIRDFMIQGGMVNENFAPIEGEFSSNGFTNLLAHTKGVLSMARTSDKNSATSQFFIMHETSPHLDGEYASFGGLISGFNILDYIANTSVDRSDKPLNNIVIESVTVAYDKAKLENIALAPYEVLLSDTNPVITITVKDFGVLTAQLFPSIAPNTVNNFLTYVTSEKYDEAVFHRIISSFMIQGGEVLASNSPIPGEFISNGFVNLIPHARGVLSMARTNDKNSATSQFFIMHEAAPHLHGNYAAFGGLVTGFDVLDLIAGVKTDNFDEPLTPVVIESITVELNGYIIKEVIYTSK